MTQNWFQYQRGAAAAEAEPVRETWTTVWAFRTPKRGRDTEKFCNAVNLLQDRRTAHLRRREAIKTLVKRSVTKSHLGGQTLKGD